MKKARKYFVRDAEEVCDEAAVEEFRCSDKAFMSWVSVGAVTMIVAIALFIFGMPVISLLLTLITVFFIVSEFFFYKQTLDVFFKKKDTANVIGKVRSAGETKKRIILCGHTDSAFEWTYTYHGGRPAVATVIGVFVFNEKLGILTLIGIALVLLSAVILKLPRKSSNTTSKY